MVGLTACELRDKRRETDGAMLAGDRLAKNKEDTEAKELHRLFSEDGEIYPPC
jgi:hypothetical protein